MSEPEATAGADERRSRLLGIKLRALVADQGGGDVDPVLFPGGSAAITDGTAWVLIDGPASRSLGPALGWAVRQGATSLELLAAEDTGQLARRAGALSFPVAVWFVEDRTVLPAVAEPLPVALDPPADHLALIPLIEAAGAVPAVEHGVVTGEVRGLEVCRVVDHPTVGRFAELSDVVPPSARPAPDDLDAAVRRREEAGVVLEVGVGPNDREAFQLLHGDIPTPEALAAVVESVATHRSLDAPQHPLNRLARERFLRWRIEQDPALVGLGRVTATPPPIPRSGLGDAVPCVAAGFDADGGEMRVVCSTGVDLDLVPFVADVQLADDLDVVVAAPGRDLVALTRELADHLTRPVRLVAVD